MIRRIVCSSTPSWRLQHRLLKALNSSLRSTTTGIRQVTNAASYHTKKATTSWQLPSLIPQQKAQQQFPRFAFFQSRFISSSRIAFASDSGSGSGSDSGSGISTGRAGGDHQHHQQQQQQDPIERRPLIVRNLITARSKKVIDYEEALELQDQLVQLRKRDQIPDTMLLLQHPHIYTVGIRNQASLEEHLLISNEEAEKIGARIHVTGRGGDITYHGPGQLVVYPIMDLQHLKKNLRWYVNRLEEVMIRTVREVIYEKTAGKEIVDPFRIDSMVGVWIAAAKQHLHAKQQQQQRPQNQNQILLLQEYYNMNRKIGAVGIHMSRWVSSFGVALNVDTDLSMFSHIVPCGELSCY
eukprot:GEZU01021217.1.p1 GENE.GEZU01021217.1~~GEZU01021217.1.p1  ORF type:complete len:353 (-),score=73.01 GEZU01021217.1:171-1229(-)